MNITLLLSIWIALLAAVLSLAAYRALVARKEDDLLHVHDAEANLIPVQVEVDHRLSVIERWGKTMTAVMVVYGAALLLYFLYTTFAAQYDKVVVG